MSDEFRNNSASGLNVFHTRTHHLHGELPVVPELASSPKLDLPMAPTTYLSQGGNDSS